MTNSHTGTPAEKTGKRCTDFSNYVRSECAGIKHKFTAFDIDFVFRDYGRKKIQIVETKTRQNEFSLGVSEGQKHYLPEIAAIFAAGIKAGAPAPGWEWHGLHLIQFERTMPTNGKVWWDGELVSEYELFQLIEMR